MTPRQQLLHDIGMPDADETIKPILDNYAIGRWVPVSERLPEFKDRKWKGIFRRDDVEYAGVFNFNEFLPGDKWLDLDMPTEKGEA